MPAENLTARLGRWSAQHRRKAIIGWLAFVVAVTAIGMTVGTKTLESPTGNGASRVADHAIHDAGFRDEATEQVLVQATGSQRVTSPAYAAAVADTVRRLQAVAHVTEVTDPLAPGRRGQLSKDGRSALVTFKLAGDTALAEARVGRAQDAVAAAQHAHPSVRIEEYGQASAGKAASETWTRTSSAPSCCRCPSPCSSCSSRSARSSRPACRSCSRSPRWKPRSACLARSAS
ncbi:MAG: hypothetical protein ACRDK0_11950 [Solirubrobacteraceae bacterium]